VVGCHNWQVVAREKASNEAKSEFMSLMCHEVRTPLNGCLASAEMLLETVLQVTLDSQEHHVTRCQKQKAAHTMQDDFPFTLV
jgi:signal transduction histidine kinase